MQCASAAAVMALAVATASAANDNWINSAGGSWGANGNWSLSAPPGDANQAVFSLGATTPYTVTLPATESAGGVTVQNDQLSLDLAGHNLTMNYQTSGGDLNLNLTATAGNSSALTLTDSTTTASTFEVGKSVTLSGAGTTSLTVNGITIQNNDNPSTGFSFGAGSTVAVENGGALDNGNLGNMSVAGTVAFNDGSATVVSNVTVGGAVGTAMNLSNGSTVTAPQIVIGADGEIGGSQVADSKLICTGGGNDLLSVGGGTRSATSAADVTSPGGTGTLMLSAGGSANAAATYIGAAGGTGTATITGAGSKLTSANLQVGVAGTGGLTVSGGATLTGGGAGAYIGGDAGNGTLTITDVGTKWNAGSSPMTTASVTVGADQNGVAGTGVLTVESSAATAIYGSLTVGAGGTLNVTSGASLSANNLNLAAAGSVNFTGGAVTLNGGTLTDPSLALTPTTTLAGDGTDSGALTNNGAVTPGTVSVLGAHLVGTLNVTGTYTQSATGALELYIGGGVTPGTANDQLTIDGAATLGGTLTVLLDDEFQPTVGDQFDLLTFASEAGIFSTIDLPALPGGESWNTSQLYTNGTISVVPEPTAAGLLGLGATLLGARRRR